MSTFFTPSKGYAQNPFVKAEFRNLSCPCNSGKKVKKCCGRVNYIAEDLVEPIQKWCDAMVAGREAHGADLPKILAAFKAKNQNELIINKGETTIED